MIKVIGIDLDGTTIKKDGSIGELKNGVIKKINLMGDYFLIGDLDRDLLDLLKNVPFTREAVEEKLANINLGTVIRNFKLPQFLRLLFGRTPHVMKPEWLKIDLTSKNIVHRFKDFFVSFT